MVELIASGIVLLGNQCGVWSPSHPELYPEQSTECIVEAPETTEDSDDSED